MTWDKLVADMNAARTPGMHNIFWMHHPNKYQNALLPESGAISAQIFGPDLNWIQDVNEATNRRLYANEPLKDRRVSAS